MEVQPFSPEMHSSLDVQAFECGDEEWAAVMAAYLKAPPDEFGAAKHVAENGYNVWLYYEGDNLVGFGSIGTFRWTINRKKFRVSFLQACAVATEFQGKPQGDQQDRYSWRILSDIAAREKERGRRFLGLHVDKRNLPAIRFFQDFGFEHVEELDRVHRMILDLSD